MEIGIIVNTVVINDDGHVLLVKRSVDNDVEPNLWDIPGGTLEWGEDPDDGAKRELKEESGINTTEVHLFGQLSNIDTEKNKQFIRLLFWTKYTGEEIKLAEDEHSEYVWIKPDEINMYGCVDFVTYALFNFPKF